MSCISAQSLVMLAVRALTGAGVSELAARQTAEALVAADVDGLSSHGVARLPSYLAQVETGKINPRAIPQLRRISGSAVCVDARAGFAYPALRMGLDAAVSSARDAAVTAVAVTNSNHFGAAGYHAEYVAKAGLAALGFGNSPAAIAPWGGSRAIFGTNPIAFAIPRRSQAPLVIDLSLSAVARGKVMIARRRNESIPLGWGLDRNGQPTTQPDLVLDGGSMVPLGGGKGAVLALIVEVMSAVLTGAHFGFEASSNYVPDGPAQRVGQFFIVIDPLQFAGPTFEDRLEKLIDAIESQPGTRLPGSRRLHLRKQHLGGGVDIPDSLLSDLRERCRGRA